MRDELDALRGEHRRPVGSARRGGPGLRSCAATSPRSPRLRDEVGPGRRAAGRRRGARTRCAQELGQLAELRADMGRLRAELTEQLSSEMLVERIVMRTQASRLPADQGRLDGPAGRWALGRRRPAARADRRLAGGPARRAAGDPAVRAGARRAAGPRRRCRPAGPTPYRGTPGAPTGEPRPWDAPLPAPPAEAPPHRPPAGGRCARAGPAERPGRRSRTLWTRPPATRSVRRPPRRHAAPETAPASRRRRPSRVAPPAAPPPLAAGVAGRPVRCSTPPRRRRLRPVPPRRRRSDAAAAAPSTPPRLPPAAPGRARRRSRRSASTTAAATGSPSARTRPRSGARHPGHAGRRDPGRERRQRRRPEAAGAGATATTTSPTTCSPACSARTELSGPRRAGRRRAPASAR